MVRYGCLLLLLTSCTPVTPAAPTLKNLQPESAGINAKIHDAVKTFTTARSDRQALLKASKPMSLQDVPGPRLKDAGDGAVVPIPGAPLKLANKGDKQRLFQQTRTSVCFPAALSAEYNSIASALLLFDPVQSKQVGTWLSYVEGGLGVLGGATEIGGFVGSNDTAKWLGAAGLGLGAVFAFLKAVVPNGLAVIQKSILRVEFNRQLGILIRQYTGSVEKITTLCTSLRAYAVGLPLTGDTIEPTKLADLKTVLDLSDSFYTGILSTGAAAQKIYDEIKGKLLSDPQFIDQFVVDNIKAIVDAKDAMGDEWASEKLDVQNAITCIEKCQPAS